MDLVQLNENYMPGGDFIEAHATDDEIADQQKEVSMARAQAKVNAKRRKMHEVRDREHNIA